MAGPLQHFQAAILDAWRDMRLLLTCAAGRVFEVGLYLMSMVPCSSLIVLMFVREIKALLRSIMVGGEEVEVVWNGLLLGRVRSQVVPCRFCGAPDSDVHLFWRNLLFLLLLRFVKTLIFMIS